MTSLPASGARCASAGRLTRHRRLTAGESHGAGAARSASAPIPARAARPSPACPWSMRVLTHRLAGSMSCIAACLATIVVPGSTSRALTTRSTGLVAEETPCTAFGRVPRAGACDLRTALRFGEPGLRGADGARHTLRVESSAGHAIVEVERTEFGEQLPARDRIARVDEHACHAAGGGWAERMAAAMAKAIGPALQAIGVGAFIAGSGRDTRRAARETSAARASSFRTRRRPVRTRSPVPARPR